VTPPLSANTEKLSKDIESVKPYVTAINYTDSSYARPRMSSIVCNKVALDHDVEPVLQIAARDTTRIGLQAEIIGVNELGVFNVLCLSGDSARVGPSPRSNMTLLDIDSVQMLWLLRRMRDEGIYLDGRKMKNPPKLFLDAASPPFASDPALQALRDHKKVNAGAHFYRPILSLMFMDLTYGWNNLINGRFSIKYISLLVLLL
jgi:methylenetetrahydrofolate reductase (NADPH)